MHPVGANPSRAPAGAGLTSTPWPTDISTAALGKAQQQQGPSPHPHPLQRGLSHRQRPPALQQLLVAQHPPQHAAWAVLTCTRPSHAQQHQHTNGRELCSSPIAPQTTGPQTMVLLLHSNQYSTKVSQDIINLAGI